MTRLVRCALALVACGLLRSAPIAAQPAAPGAAQVALYEQDPAVPDGRRYAGSVVWKLEPAARGAPAGVRADIEIPERGLKATISLVRNDDAALPATHTVQIAFTTPPNFDMGKIDNVPGLLMKRTETERGTPLVGQSVKVADNVFLLGLSAVGVDAQRNVELLRDRQWLDVPIVYTNGRRAIMGVEKGASGSSAFQQATGLWSIPAPAR